MAISFTPTKDSMHGDLGGIATFPESTIGLTIPESIGDAANPVWFDEVSLRWERTIEDEWLCVGEREDELSYTATVAKGDDTVDVETDLANESSRHWRHSYAFICCNPGPFTPVTDYECVRHWVRSDGEFKRLIEVPRKFSSRATIQLYDVEGPPTATDAPFVDEFNATPDVSLEPWLAIESHDGDRYLAVVSDPPLFLFQNMEYSCIHSCPTFGPLAPGESGTGLTRIYLVESSLEALSDRIHDDFDWKRDTSESK